MLDRMGSTALHTKGNQTKSATGEYQEQLDYGGMCILGTTKGQINCNKQVLCSEVQKNYFLLRMTRV
jgi:hypothetical protein